MREGKVTRKRANKRTKYLVWGGGEAFKTVTVNYILLHRYIWLINLFTSIRRRYLLLCTVIVKHLSKSLERQLQLLNYSPLLRVALGWRINFVRFELGTYIVSEMSFSVSGSNTGRNLLRCWVLVVCYLMQYNSDTCPEAIELPV